MGRRLIERRYGICRTVFLVGRWAIKVPRMRNGAEPVGLHWTLPRAVLANQSEKQWLGVAGTCPVLHSWLGGLINVYPRAEPWPEDGPEPDYDKIGGPDWLPRDRKRSNIGLLDGQPVWLDYDGSWNGCPHSRNAAGLVGSEG